MNSLKENESCIEEYYNGSYRVTRIFSKGGNGIYFNLQHPTDSDENDKEFKLTINTLTNGRVLLRFRKETA